jgi:hypothetical protein
MILENLNKSGLFKNMLTAYLILMLHVVLLAGIGLTVILFKGMYQYLPWITAGFCLLVFVTVWIIYQRIKKNSMEIKDILSMPEFQERTVDIKLLGGIASFKITPEKNHQTLLVHNTSNNLDTPMLENNATNTK